MTTRFVDEEKIIKEVSLLKANTIKRKFLDQFSMPAGEELDEAEIIGLVEETYIIVKIGERYHKVLLDKWIDYFHRKEMDASDDHINMYTKILHGYRTTLPQLLLV